MLRKLRLGDAVVAIEPSAMADVVGHIVAKDDDDVLILWTGVPATEPTPGYDGLTDSRLSRCRPDSMLPHGNGIWHVPMPELEPLP